MIAGKIALFISYTHDSTTHMKWVSTLAARLREHHLHVSLDQDMRHGGGDIITLAVDAMEEADFVVILFTPLYKSKVKDRNAPAFVKLEFNCIINDYYLVNPARAKKKYIAVLVCGDRNTSIPMEFPPLYTIDMRRRVDFEKGIAELLQTIRTRWNGDSPGGAYPPQNPTGGPSATPGATPTAGNTPNRKPFGPAAGGAALAGGLAVVVTSAEAKQQPQHPHPEHPDQPDHRDDHDHHEHPNHLLHHDHTDNLSYDTDIPPPDDIPDTTEPFSDSPDPTIWPF